MAGDDQMAIAAHTPSVVDRLVTLTRQRTQWHRAEKKLTLQIKAIERGFEKSAAEDQERSETHVSDVDPADADAGDLYRSVTPGGHVVSGEEGGEGHSGRDDQARSAELALFITAPLIEARAGLKRHRLNVQRELKAEVVKLPIWPTVHKIRGLGPLGLALIIGQARDLSLYGNPAKLWKRMGLGIVGGSIQKRTTDKRKAKAFGYSPSRRSLMHNIGDALMKQNDGIYRQLYEERKVHELARLPDVKGRIGWAHKRALRYIEKRLLKDLWQAWRNA